MTISLLHRRLGALVAVLAVLLGTATAPVSAHNGTDHETPPAPGAYTSQAQALEANLHDLPVGPLTVATWPAGPAHAVLVGSQHGLDLGVLETNAAGSYDDGWNTADAQVAHLSGGLQGILTLDLGAITAECRSDGDGQTGSASVAGGTIKVAGHGVLTIPLNPAPNTTLSIPGVLDIVLNKQVTHPDGSLSVTAIDIHGTKLLQTLLLTMHPLYLTVAQATCDQIVPPYQIPVAAGAGMIGAGIAVLGLGCGWVLLVRHRRRAPVAAG